MASPITQLDGGNSEVEILEFILNGQTFGVNVLKIEAIEQFDVQKVTTIPMSPPHVAGTLLFRNRTIPLIDLRLALGMFCESSPQEQQSGDSKDGGRVVLVTEFNQTTCAFIADGVNKIHRIRWSDISPMDQMFGQAEFTGSFHVDGREVLIVDMEKYVGDIMPEATSNLDGEAIPQDHELAHLRPDVKIIFVEDSGTMRSLIREVLSKGNYSHVTTYNNGQAAFDAISGLKQTADDEGEDILHYVTLVITDIEMPQMNGLTLCRNIKQTLGLVDLPVVMFSTQINDSMAENCRRVQADGWVSKPQVTTLVEMIDQLTLEKLSHRLTPAK